MLPLYQELIQHGGLKIWIYRQVNGIIFHQDEFIIIKQKNRIHFFHLGNVGSASILGFSKQMSQVLFCPCIQW